MTLHLAQLQGRLLPESSGTGLQPSALPARCPRRARKGQDIGKGVAQALHRSALKLWRVQRRWKRQVRARLLVDDNKSAPVTTGPSRRADVRGSKPVVRNKHKRANSSNAKLSPWQLFFADFIKKAQSSSGHQARQHMREAAVAWSAHKSNLEQPQEKKVRVWHGRIRKRPELTAEASAERLKMRQEHMARARKHRHLHKGPDPQGPPDVQTSGGQSQLASDIAAAGA